MATILARRLEKQDLPVRVEWFNHESVYPTMTLEVPMSLAATEQWLTKNALNPARRDFTFVLQDSETGNPPSETVVAMAGLVEIDRTHQRAEAYFVVNPALTGRGYGKKIYNWTCNYAFIVLGLNRVFAYQYGDNPAARRVIESQGWTIEGTFRQHIYSHGRFVDRVITGLLREEWEKLPWRADGPLSMKIPV